MKIRPHLMELEEESYEKDISAGQKLVDCGLAKNNLGSSPGAIDFFQSYDPSGLWESFDINYTDLKKDLCKLWSDHVALKPDNIKIANGSRFVQERFNKIFIGEKTKIFGFAPQYAGYVTVVAVAGGIYEYVPLNPEDNFTFNPDIFIRHLKSDYPLVFIDNPSNPTGQTISLDAIEEIVKECKKKGSVVFVDEAFGDYLDESFSAICLLHKYSNLAVTRTFSKAYGMGKFKVGYGIMPLEIAGYYNKVSRGVPGAVSDLGSKLARQALADQNFILKCRQWVIREKAKILQGLRKTKYIIPETHESSPIFVLGNRDKEVDLREDLIKKGILSVSGSHFHNLGKNYVRITLPSNPDELLKCLLENDA